MEFSPNRNLTKFPSPSSSSFSFTIPSSQLQLYFYLFFFARTKFLCFAFAHTFTHTRIGMNGEKHIKRIETIYVGKTGTQVGYSNQLGAGDSRIFQYVSF